MLTLRDSASVTIAPIEGTPRATAEKLGPAMASALQQREIAASDKTASIGSYELVGRIQEMRAVDGKAAAGGALGAARSFGRAARRAHRAARGRRRAAWEQGNDDAVARLAAASAARSPPCCRTMPRRKPKSAGVRGS